MATETKQAVYLSARERAAIIGGLKPLSAHAWDERLYGEKVDSEAIAGLLEVATESFRFDMLNPEEIDALCDRVHAE